MTDGSVTTDEPEPNRSRRPRGWSDRLPVVDGGIVSGDGVGLALFLGSLVATGLTWQIGVFITDSYAVANALRNLAAGSFDIERLYYGLTLRAQPGLRLVDGGLYARNYGHVFLALPVYVALDALSAVADLRHLLIAAWSLLVFAFVRQIGRLADRRTTAAVVGSALALALFWGNVALATPLEDGAAGIAALQLVSMTSVAVTAVAIYRLVDRFHGRRPALAVGAAAVLASPLWFWAAIPKRHAMVAAGVAVALYGFGASRRANDPFLPRAAAYAAAVFVIWVHAFEGIVLLVALLATDLPTAPPVTRRRALALVAVLAVSFAPVLATNAAITGDPVEPPRMAGESPYGDDVTVGPDGTVSIETAREPGSPSDGSDGGDTDTGGGDTGTGGPSADAGGESPPAFGTLDWAQRQADRIPYAGRFAGIAATAPDRVYRTYVRSGRIGFGVSYGVNDEEAIELTLLESLPVAGVLAGSVVLVGGRIGRRVRSRRRVPRDPLSALGRVRDRVRTANPARQTDALACLVVAGFAVIYLPFLPLHSQLTVRYVLPMVPALLYLVARVPTVRTAIDGAFRPLVVGYASFVGLGLAAMAFGFPALDPAVGEAMQLHALVNLVAAAIAASLVLARSAGVGVADRTLALALALAAAATTVLIVAMQLAYFEYGTALLPITRAAADALAVLG